MTKRSRFGCQTCKIRRVKCDETLPFCKRCTDTGRLCDGTPKHKTRFVVSQPPKHKRMVSASGSSRSSITPPSQQLAPVPDLPAAGKRALSFFIDRAGPALGGELDQEFWHASVLQLCHQSSMVRNAVLAVSTLYESPLSHPLNWPITTIGNLNKPEQRQAFKWYSESLSGMSAVLHQPQTMEQLHVALTTCILFACIEFQQLNVVNAIQLMRCGYNLLGQDTTKESMSRSPIIRHILLPIFVRQTVVLCIHGVPLPEGWLPPELNVSDSASMAISSLQEARTQLYLMLLDVCSIVNAAYVAFSHESLDGVRKLQSRTLDRFAIWRKSLDTYLLFVNQYQGLTPAQARALSLLNIYYLLATTWLTACTYPDEMIWDTFAPEMNAILDHTEKIMPFHQVAHVTYTFEMGIIPPIYFVGWRCRVPDIRRRALQLLSRCPNQESLFHRDVAIFGLHKIIQIEEGLPQGTDVLTTQGVVPVKHARLRHVLVRWKMEAVKNGNVAGESKPHLLHSQWLLKEGNDGQIREMRPPVTSI